MFKTQTHISMFVLYFIVYTRTGVGHRSRLHDCIAVPVTLTQKHCNHLPPNFSVCEGKVNRRLWTTGLLDVKILDLAST